MEVLNISEEQLILMEELVNHGISIKFIATQAKVSTESVANYIFDIWKNKSIDNLEKWVMLLNVYSHCGYDIDSSKITKEEYFNILKLQGVLEDNQKNIKKLKKEKKPKVMSA